MNPKRMENNNTGLLQRIKSKWRGLSKNEKTGVSVLLAVVLGVVIFAIGIEIGTALYHAFGR